MLNMTMPLVSVIMPCYNSQQYVAEALDSVLQQDYPNLEVIVVDDGSTDNSLQILQQYADQNSDRITIIRQANQGPAAARNTGMQAATGKYIAFNDSDDLWLPGKVRAQVNYLENHPETGLCFSSWAVWDQQQPLPQLLQKLRLQQADITDDTVVADRTGWLYLPLLESSVVHTTSAMLRHNLIQNVGLFNTGYRLGEDHDYWLRISQYCQMAKLARVFSVYRDNPNGTTKRIHPKNYSLLVLESALAQYGLNCPSGNSLSQWQANQYLGERHFTYGYSAMLQGDRTKARFAFRHCIKYRYKTLKSLWLLLACSTAPGLRLFLQLKQRTG